MLNLCEVDFAPKAHGNNDLICWAAFECFMMFAVDETNRFQS